MANTQLTTRPSAHPTTRSSTQSSTHSSTQGTTQRTTIPPFSMLRRETAMPQSLLLPVLVFTLLFLSGTAAYAYPVLSEIHYNGVATGADPDEFIELSNPGALAIDLEGWTFTAGIEYTFGTGSTLGSRESVVLARDPLGFRDLFSSYRGQLFDFAGALSNSGETLALVDSTGTLVWSVSYDDRSPWPAMADGLGNSLQLAPAFDDLTSPKSWEAKQPTPGIWSYPTRSPSKIPAPGSILLLTAGALMLRPRILRSNRATAVT